MDRNARNNRSNMRNPNNVGYWKSRGFQNRPDVWQKMLQKTSSSSNNDQGSASSWSWIVAGVGAVAAGAFLVASIFNTDTAEPSEQRDADRSNARR